MCERAGSWGNDFGNMRPIYHHSMEDFKRRRDSIITPIYIIRRYQDDSTVSRVRVLAFQTGLAGGNMVRLRGKLHILTAFTLGMGQELRQERGILHSSSSSSFLTSDYGGGSGGNCIAYFIGTGKWYLLVGAWKGLGREFSLNCLHLLRSGWDGMGWAGPGGRVGSVVVFVITMSN